MRVCRVLTKSGAAQLGARDSSAGSDQEQGRERLAPLGIQRSGWLLLRVALSGAAVNTSRSSGVERGLTFSIPYRDLTVTQSHDIVVFGLMVGHALNLY
ncbi:hypothetical protein RRG08_019452 [Elysia crispata]|uniref:Uncharacterized protein n=1 Tax=Elysia crispata TaxID=231223 RepID=A0AAE1CW08_9GAST|nr:hypothetical protein RRG08_019452 [Elysia crispata]